jgi:hypothetical protein
VTVSFDWEEKKAGYPIIAASGLLVRLFDRNGHFVTMFTTEPPRQLIDAKNHIEATYDLSEDKLAAVKKAEVGAFVR